MMPLLTGERDTIRDVAYMEYTSHENPFPWTVNLDYRIVRKGKYKYIRWIRFEDEAELYDLDEDPYELNNLVGDPALKKVITDLRAELRRLALVAARL